MPMNFANAKIYAIRSHQTEQIYIGSTCQPLYKRFYHHKCKPCSSREILKYPDAFIELLEEFPCANKMQLNKREGHLIRTMNCVNNRIAGRTNTEYYIDNQIHILEKCKQYREEHKENILEKCKQYREEHKTEIKQYRDEHKEHISEYHKQYRTDNQEKIKEHKNQKYTCDCGSRYTTQNKARHFKSHKHLEFIRQLSA